MMLDLPTPLLALLHEGGWDEMIMVAVGLIVAYAVITWTGRRSRDDDEDDDEADADEPDVIADTATEQPRSRTPERPSVRPEDPSER